MRSSEDLFVFCFSKSLKIGLCVLICECELVEFQESLHRVWFQRFERKFPAARYMTNASRCRWFPYFSLCLFWIEWIDSFIAAIYLFQVHVGQFKRGCFLDTHRTLLKNSLWYMYNFSKLWSLFLKEVLIIKFHCLWMLSFIFLYVLYSVFFKIILILSIVLILYYHYFCIIVHACELMHLITICLTTILARNFIFLIWVTIYMYHTHEWLPIKHSFVRFKISPTNLVFELIIQKNFYSRTRFDAPI